MTVECGGSRSGIRETQTKVRHRCDHIYFSRLAAVAGGVRSELVLSSPIDTDVLPLCCRCEWLRRSEPLLSFHRFHYFVLRLSRLLTSCAFATFFVVPAVSGT